MDKQVLKLGARILENLPEMSREAVQDWIDDPKKLKDFLSGMVPVKRHLSDPVQFTLTGEIRKLRDFFREDRERLGTSPDFQSEIRDYVPSGSVKVTERALCYADLLLPSTNSDIGKELPEGYIFENVGFFLAILALLIEKQLRGDEGLMLNTGYRVNLFFVRMGGEVLVVDVHWDFKSRIWNCDCDVPFSADLNWSPGYRVFWATAA